MIGPADLQGCWRRDWLTAPGVRDAATRVVWMQAGDLFADIRIPADRPDTTGVATLADLPDAALLALLRAEGFAGSITVANDICTWTRAINWHGRPEGEDSGHLTFKDPDTLLETGVHADYAELWRRAPAGPAQGAHYNAGPLQAWLVTVGAEFVFGVGDPAAPPSAETLAALRSGRRTEALRAQFRRAHVLGRWRGEQGVATLATNPLLEGEVMLRRAGDALIWRAVDFDGAARDLTLTPVQAAVQSAR